LLSKPVISPSEIGFKPVCGRMDCVKVEEIKCR